MGLQGYPWGPWLLVVLSHTMSSSRCAPGGFFTWCCGHCLSMSSGDIGGPGCPLRASGMLLQSLCAQPPLLTPFLPPGTPTAPAAPAFSGHVAVAPVTSWGVGTQAVSPAHSAATVPGGIHAQPRSEEPSMNFTLRLLHGECSGTCVRPQVGGARPWDGPYYEGFGVLISLMGDVALFCSLGLHQKGAAGLK